MTPDKDATLRRKYHLVFQRRLVNDEPIRCSDGWLPLLEKLCLRLTRLIQALPRADRPQYYAKQVKEKFGLLRFYMSEVTPAMAGAIRDAETEAEATCDICGEPGDLCSQREDGSADFWVRTRCKTHEHLRVVSS